MGLMSTVKHAFKDDEKDATHHSHHRTHDPLGKPIASSTTVVENDTVAAPAPVVVDERVERTVSAAPVAANSTSAVTTDAASISSASSQNVRRAEPVVETQIKTHAPIVQSRHHTDIVEEITPNVEIEKTGVQVQQIYQPVEDKRVYEQHEQQVNPTQIKEHVEEISDEAAARYQANANAFQSIDVTEDTTRSTHVNPANVTEHTHITKVQEITPVIHREEELHKVIHTQQNIVEKYQLAPKVAQVEVKPPMSIEEFKAQGGVVDAGIQRENVREL